MTGGSQTMDGRASVSQIGVGAMLRTSRAIGNGGRRRTAVRSAIEIAVALVASVVMALMVVGGGIAAEHAAAPHSQTDEVPHLSPRETT